MLQKKDILSKYLLLSEGNSRGKTGSLFIQWQHLHSISQVRLMSKMNNEVKLLNNNKKNSPIEKWAKDLVGHFSNLKIKFSISNHQRNAD